MMSLIKADLAEILKKQYFFKFKANIDVFSSLVGLQLLAVLFSLGGGMYSGYYGGGMDISMKLYSADMVILFTMIWALITSVTITTKPYRNYEFTFVTNRISSSLSNILFLLTISLLAGFTSMLSANLIHVLVYFFIDSGMLIYEQHMQDIITGVISTSLYIFLFCSFGYLFGAFIQVHKVFSGLIPVGIIGLLLFDGMKLNSTIAMFYFNEPSLFMFFIKTIILAGIAFAVAILILRNMEVKR
ncbi:hypothetical protein [Bacillus sp. CRN 9]|uniref:hypothetical protein n=1 Tax=Cytobacillus horneckiae TaxID=549687 RepID=UPI001562A222